MKKLARWAAILALCCSAAAAPQVALAEMACTDTYTEDGCHAGTHCDHYDDETGEWIGSVTIEYQC